MLTKEAYKKLNDNTYGVRFIRPFSEYTLKEVFETLTEFEELKRDIARFIELTFSDDINSDDWQEYLALKNKLSKVGKEE